MISPMHGPDAPMHGAHTTARATISNSFCLGCYTTGVTPDLVYADGSRADIDTGVMLHHSVLGEKGGLDHTCQSPEFRERFGKRVYASGNERTGAHLPAGFGMKTSGADLVVEIELMNMTDQPKTVYHTLKTTVANPFFSFMMKRVEPVWLDQAGCDSASEFPVPVGESRHTWEWTSTISGTVKAVGGHLHDGGQTLTVSNAATGKVLCAMTAEYGTKPSSMGHLDKMTPVCTGTLGTVKRGEKLRQDSTYHIKYADPGAMAISSSTSPRTDRPARWGLPCRVPTGPSPNPGARAGPFPVPGGDHAACPRAGRRRGGDRVIGRGVRRGGRATVDVVRAGARDRRGRLGAAELLGRGRRGAAQRAGDGSAAGAGAGSAPVRGGARGRGDPGAPRGAAPGRGAGDRLAPARHPVHPRG
ncbi:hypothetical protein ACFQV2_20165 [Actinokineospora soli]|uniref:Uncharacterized protein n=1 Tax=Actinokineospora soli TaxID=1048753 RepID=A0ABW2TPM6_9PSEU